MRRPFQIMTSLLLISLSANIHAHESTAHYMANEGLMVEHGDTKILFDPLFRNDYGQYMLLPEDMEEALFAGATPYDGIDAVFVSHHHGDHFSPVDMVRLLRERPGIRLYAPNQAIIAMRSESSKMTLIFMSV